MHISGPHGVPSFIPGVCAGIKPSLLYPPQYHCQEELYCFMYITVLPACTCVYHVCSEPTGAKRKHWIPWDCSYGQLWATVWAPGNTCASSVRAMSALSCWPNSVAPTSYLFICFVFAFVTFEKRSVSVCKVRDKMAFIRLAGREI